MNEAQEELEILLPDGTLTVGQEEVEVRELRFGETLRYAVEIRELVEALEGLQAAEPGDELVLFDAALAGHWQAVLTLVAASTGRAREWIEALGDEDGQRLVYAWWAVNAGFFVRRLVARRMARSAPAPTSSATARSSSSSSPPATDATRRTSPADSPGGRSASSALHSAAGTTRSRPG